MDADLPSCERTECWGWFPRLFLDVLWLRASVIMPRSWLLDGFSTIRAHYSSLGLSCSSLHPSEHAHTHLYTPIRCADGQMEGGTCTHMHTYNTQTQIQKPPPQLKMAPPRWCWLSARGGRCLVNGDGWESEQSVGGQQVVRFQVPAGAGRAEGARLCGKQGHQQFLTHGRRDRPRGRCVMAFAFKTNRFVFFPSYFAPHVIQMFFQVAQTLLNYWGKNRENQIEIESGCRARWRRRVHSAFISSSVSLTGSRVSRVDVPPCWEPGVEVYRPGTARWAPRAAEGSSGRKVGGSNEREKPEGEKGRVDSSLCFHIWGQINYALTCVNWYIQGLTCFSLTCSSDHVICRCVASPEGGTRAQKLNLHTHIHPGNLIPSTITDNMLLVSQKKDNTQGYNPPPVLIYTSNCTCAPGLDVLVPPPPVTVGYQLQKWTIYRITMVLSGRGALFLVRKGRFDG